MKNLEVFLLIVVLVIVVVYKPAQEPRQIKASRVYRPAQEPRQIKASRVYRPAQEPRQIKASRDINFRPELGKKFRLTTESRAEGGNWLDNRGEGNNRQELKFTQEAAKKDVGVWFLQSVKDFPQYYRLCSHRQPQLCLTHGTGDEVLLAKVDLARQKAQSFVIDSSDNGRFFLKNPQGQGIRFLVSRRNEAQGSPLRLINRDALTNGDEFDERWFLIAA